MESLSQDEIESRAKSLAKDQLPGARSYLVTAIVPSVMNGHLVTVTLTHKDRREEDLFIHVTRENVRRFYDVEDMANSVSQFTLRKKTWWEIFWEFFGVHGMLAVLILAVIIWHAYATNWQEPPNWLVAAFSTVIGYFFGRFTHRQPQPA